MADASGPQLISTTGDADSDQIIVPEVCCLIFIYLIPRFGSKTLEYHIYYIFFWKTLEYHDADNHQVYRFGSNPPLNICFVLFLILRKLIRLIRNITNSIKLNEEIAVIVNNMHI